MRRRSRRCPRGDEAAARKRRVRARARIVRGELGSELAELGRGGGRPTSGRLLRRRSRARRRQSVGAGSQRAPDGGRALRSPSPPPRARDARHGASRPAPARSRSRRAADARSEWRSRRARRLLRPPRPRALREHAPASPCAAATRSTVGRASAATSSRTSRVSPGRRARRPPSSSLQALGHAQRLARRRSRVRSTSSRPSSSAKNGLPAVASCTRASSGRVSSSPSRSSSRRCTAASVSGPSASRSAARSGTSARARRARHSGPSLTVAKKPDRLLAKSPERDLQHTRRGRVEPLGVVERDQHRPVLGKRRSTSSTASPIACGSGAARPARRAAARPRAQPPRRRERRPDLVQHAPSSSESPAKESEASASTPLHVRMRAEPAASVWTPPPRARSCRSPARRRGRARPDRRRPRKEHLDRAKLLVAPDNSRFTHRLGHCGRPEPPLSSMDRLQPPHLHRRRGVEPAETRRPRGRAATWTASAAAPSEFGPGPLNDPAECLEIVCHMPQGWS